LFCPEHYTGQRRPVVVSVNLFIPSYIHESKSSHLFAFNMEQSFKNLHTNTVCYTYTKLCITDCKFVEIVNWLSNIYRFMITVLTKTVNLPKINK
jgi:hypothetical protein